MPSATWTGPRAVCVPSGPDSSFRARHGSLVVGACRLGNARALAFAAAMLWSAAPAAAAVSFHTGEDLLGYCLSPRSSDACVGYLSGVADAASAGDTLFGFRFCIPSGTTHAQLRDVIVAYIGKHPEARAAEGASVAAAALAVAWPCPKP